MARQRRQSDKIEVLGGVPLFAGLSKKELAEVARNVTEIDYGPGEHLVREGGRGREALVILDGKATVRRDGRKVAEVTAGDVVGEMSLVTDLPRNAAVVADTAVTALLMSSQEFSSIIEENPRVAVKVLRTVATRLADAIRPI